jgi:hypothetical protein
MDFTNERHRAYNLVAKRGRVGELTTEMTWTAGELLNQLRRRQKLFVLDVRNREEFERSPLEGAGLSAIRMRGHRYLPR